MNDEPTKAFLSSAGKVFAGVTLAPLTLQRQVCAAEMGLRRGFAAKYGIPNLLKDSIIVLWLCSIPESGKDWSVDRVEIEPEKAMKAAYAWAKTKGIGINTKAFNEAWPIFHEIMLEVENSRAEPIMDKHEPRHVHEGELEAAL